VLSKDELFYAFDRLRAGLSRQELERKNPATFGAWVVRALPHFAKLVNAVDDAERENYGDVLNAFGDWLQERKLSWRGKMTWAIPSDGPLHFEPPSMKGLMRQLGSLVNEFGLADTIRRSAQLSVGPIEKTRGTAGQRRGRPLTVRKSK